jgi:hypothetical protein
VLLSEHLGRLVDDGPVDHWGLISGPSKQLVEVANRALVIGDRVKQFVVLLNRDLTVPSLSVLTSLTVVVSSAIVLSLLDDA